MAKQQTVYHAYTTKYEGITQTLINDVELISQEKRCAGKAQWDTGATRTCISKDVVKQLDLVPTGMINISTPSGTKVVHVYMIDVLLPNSLLVKNVQACGTEIGSQGIQVLIGMDIIALGDFAVSNAKNQTVFSFRIPSKEHTDLVKQIRIENKIGPKHGQGKRKKKK